MEIEGLGYDYWRGGPTVEQMLHAGGTAKAEAAGAARAQGLPDAEHAFMQRLAGKYPTAHFSVGGGYTGLEQDALAKLGKGNIMVDEGLLRQMVAQPRTADKYLDAIGSLVKDFDRLYKDAGGRMAELVAWGSFLNSMGVFSSWGVTSPFSETAGLFQFFDENLMQQMVKFETSLEEGVLRDEREMLEYEQNLEKAEDSFHHLQNANPHIQNKAQGATVFQHQMEAFSAGIEKGGIHRLDEKD